MLESLTIVTKGGLILYQYTASPSLLGAADAVAHTNHALNQFLLRDILIGKQQQQQQQQAKNNFYITAGMTFCWKVCDDTERICVALYPDILFEGPRQYLREWCMKLLEKVAVEYDLYYKASQQQQQQQEHDSVVISAIRPDPALFDQTFQVLLAQSKGDSGESAGSATLTTQPKQQQQDSKTTASVTTSKKGGKEKRHWHDGNAKVTQQAMDALDKSTEVASKENKEAAMERALQEARQAYLPDAEEVLIEQKQQQQQQLEREQQQDKSSWSTSVTNLLNQIAAGNKVLTESDLEKPLKAMQELLVAKNVSPEIAQQLIEACEYQLKGKRMNSLYRVQTAVQQAMEKVLTKLLQQHQVDLLRQVLAKKSSLLGSLTSSQRRPYVITCMGINGIGKTTTLAKLAYYFQQHNCKPLLVAGDTFRSGAVEQLQVHAACLQVDLYQQGYAVDPSAVAQAAIQHASTAGHDVVLIDTAGRMQNNVPLMKALGKLVQECQPDFVVMVCEALVGHDGLDQFRMFQAALPARRKVDGLILTKFDTVSDKVGAALTLVHETAVPIVFTGTGQKYHHLAEMSVPQVMQSLFS